jgi:hypothetical protein
MMKMYKSRPLGYRHSVLKQFDWSVCIAACSGKSPTRFVGRELSSNWVCQERGVLSS